MTNQEINIAFLNAVSAPIRDEISAAIAGHYSITKDEAINEVVGTEAEHLLDYLIGDVRVKIGILMRKENQFDSGQRTT